MEVCVLSPQQRHQAIIADLNKNAKCIRIFTLSHVTGLPPYGYNEFKTKTGWHKNAQTRIIKRLNGELRHLKETNDPAYIDRLAVIEREILLRCVDTGEVSMQNLSPTTVTSLKQRRSILIGERRDQYINRIHTQRCKLQKRLEELDEMEEEMKACVDGLSQEQLERKVGLDIVVKHTMDYPVDQFHVY